MSFAHDQAVLVLNASFEAIAVTRARRALVLLVKDAAVIQEHAGVQMHPHWLLPTVIRLKELKRIPYRLQVVSRKNILARDNHECQYCGDPFSAMELTLDHVVPRSRGGLSTWENLVACCKACNRAKADRTPEEWGKLLLRRPRPVTVHTARGILRSAGATEKAWQPYLFYDSGGSRQHVLKG